MLQGFNHITIAVKDIHRSFDFYKNVLGLKPLCRWSRGAYFLAGNLWFCLSQDDRTRSEALPEYTHFAFTVSATDFEEASRRIVASGAKIWRENVSEGPSLYFLDPDGHKLEIHVGNWQSRIEDAKHEMWEPDMKFFV